MSINFDLVGRTVTAIELDEADESIRFTFADGVQQAFTTDGDCCSHTWINDLIGVESLIGHEITAVEETDLPEPEGDRVKGYDEYAPDVLADYSLKIATSRGYFDLIYRNDSNGYYGGSLFATENGAGPWRTVTEDFSR